MIPYGKTRHEFMLLYTSRLKPSCRNPYGKTQHMVDDPPVGGEKKKNTNKGGERKINPKKEGGPKAGD